jgi:hypothetical protein
MVVLFRTEIRFARITSVNEKFLRMQLNNEHRYGKLTLFHEYKKYHAVFFLDSSNMG